MFDPDSEGPESAMLLYGGYAGDPPCLRPSVLRWNGFVWVPFGDCPIRNVEAFAIVDNDGVGPNPPTLYAGGLADVLTGTSVARWTGSAWEAVRGNVSGSDHVWAMTAHDPDGAGPLPPVLLVGGTRFDLPAFVSSWDGQAWTEDWLPLGGTDSRVRDLASFDDAGTSIPAVFIGGERLFAGFDGGSLVRWDGTASQMLPGQARVNVMAALDPDGAGPSPSNLIVGGTFAEAGGMSAPKLARWNGQDWSAIGGSITVGREVLSMTTVNLRPSGATDTTLYIVGDFTEVGGLPALNIAAWDGAAWSAMGEGLNTPSGCGMAGFADMPGREALFVIGNFNSAGPVPANGAARWGCERPPVCLADLTTIAIHGPGFGQPNGIVNNEDFFYFLMLFASGDPRADLSGSAAFGSQCFGNPDGAITNEDFFYFLTLFTLGC